MASLARSFKPPSFLSPKCRPAMSGRTISNSSDRSISPLPSPRDEETDFVFSAPGTPAVLSPGEEPSTLALHENHVFSSPRSATSRPIAIELPQVRKQSSQSIYTPTEPLSARGDRPGGYFPLHEDPHHRLHRTHPFHHESKPHSVPQTAPSTIVPDKIETRTSQKLHVPAARPSQLSNSPQIASYIPAGFHDQSLPLGKYYPSNYERRANSAVKDSKEPPSGLALPTAKSDSNVPRKRATASAAGANTDSEVRRKLLQYQRDMVAQAKMATTEVLSSSSSSGTPDILAQRNAALKELRLAAPTVHKPISPRLLPLGSPGPVTPMELEGSGGSYLDKGLSASVLKESLGAGFTARTT